MGVSTNACLFYGICEMDEDDWRLPDDLAGKVGEESEEKMYSCYDFWNNITYEKQDELEEQLGVCVSTHCSGDYPLMLVAVKKSFIIANRGCPETAIMCEITEEDKNNLTKMAYILHILEDKRNFGWWLASYWG